MIRFMPQTVAVDFDKVIHTYENGWGDGSIYGELVPGSLNALIYLMSEYAVFIHSTRDAEQICTWMNYKTGFRIKCVTEIPESGFWNEQGVILVTNRKLPAIAYIDDRAIRFVNWSQALTELGRFG